MHGADAIVLTPYIMRGEVGGVDLYTSSLTAFVNTKRPRGQNGVGKGGIFLMWFGVDIMGDEHWKIAVRDIKDDGNLLQTVVGNRNVERRRRDMSATIFSDADRSRSAPSNQVQSTAMPDGHQRFDKKWPHASISRVGAMLITEYGEINWGSCSRQLPVPCNSVLYQQ